MQNDKLINAVERALQKKLNYAYMTCSYLPEISEIAAEIAAAIAPLVEAGDKSKADQIITNFSVGEKVWLYIGSVFQEHTVKYIHIQKGEWGNTYVRYEMELVSGWYPAKAIYRTKEAAMADNR